MSREPPNPYASPQADLAPASQEHYDPVSLRKIEAIIKDAGQFWLAILICILCTGWGAFIIGPWYLVRFLQWNSMAQAYPMLLDAGAPRGSLARRFQSARTKLIIGMAFGAAILLLVILFLVVLFLKA